MGHRPTPHVPAPARSVVKEASFAGLGPVRWALVVACGLALSACGQGAPTDAFELSGRVSALLESGEEGGPIENARVEFVSDTLIIEEARTDSGGRYRMRVMTDIDFGQVRATAEGFRAREESVFFDSPMRRVDLLLRRIPE